MQAKNVVNTYPRIGSIWQNKRTETLYKVLYIGRHSETLEPLVIYQRADQTSDVVWCRPASMWLDKFDPA
jgi:hypothetical protein